jgi:hypothetical protein
MPRGKKKIEDEIENTGDVTGEYKRPNAKRAIEIYDEHISPKLTHIATIKGDLAEPWQMLKKEANIPRPVFNFVQKLVEEDDDAKREHMLRSLRELLIAYDLTIPPDLVDQAEGHNSNIVPFSPSAKPHLPGVNDEDDFEASAEELAKQEGRKVPEPQPEPGTAAEAMAAMKAKQEAAAGE